MVNLSTSTNIHYAVLGDIHTFHNKNPTGRILDNISRLLGLDDRTTNLKIIFFEGDFFDRLTDLTKTDEIADLLEWIGKLYRFAAKHMIALRFLEGTPLHDWKQSALFESVATCIAHFGYGVDVKHVKDLTVETFEDSGLSVLYIPDEWRSSTEATRLEALEAINKAGLKQVDIAVMHGAFGYQVPKAARDVPFHNEAAYLEMVKYFIHVGHYHTFSSYDRIIAAGSVDRLRMGEEEAKGMIFVNIDLETRESNWFFKENKNAMIFKSIQIETLNGTETLNIIAEAAKLIPDGHYLDVRMFKENDLANSLDVIRSQFPDIYITRKFIEHEEKEEVVLFPEFEALDDFEPITITKDNVLDLLIGDISRSNDSVDIERLMTIGRNLL